MSFFRTKTVNKPQKNYTCFLCRGGIDGKHVYISSVNEFGDFWCDRAHTECYDKCLDMCSNCEHGDYCRGDVAECFSEKIGENWRR